MEKIIFCLLLFTILLASNLIESLETKLVTCGSKETCILHNQCDEVNKMTSKGYLTDKERDYLSHRLCDFPKSEHHFCCAKKKTLTLPESPACGLYFSDRIFRNSEDTLIDEYPWTAMIMYSKPGRKIGSHCGGSLINERYILTAAHCVHKVPKSWSISSVRLGEWDTRTNPDCAEFVNEVVCNEPYVEIPVAKIIVHPKYNPKSVDQLNDIALIELEQDVKYTMWIKPICLPVDSRLRNLNLTAHSLEVSGFRLTENENSSPTKKVFYLNGISQEKCKAYYADRRVNIAYSHICAGIEEKKQACNGDSGGSLMKEGVFPNSKYAQYLLIGVESFGPKDCATKDAPGVYTLVSEHMDWIIKNST